MKRYRIYYWFNSITTDWYTKANSEEEALKKFQSIKGNRHHIISIQCVDYGEDAK